MALARGCFIRSGERSCDSSNRLGVGFGKCPLGVDYINSDRRQRRASPSIDTIRNFSPSPSNDGVGGFEGESIPSLFGPAGMLPLAAGLFLSPPPLPSLVPPKEPEKPRVGPPSGASPCAHTGPITKPCAHAWTKRSLKESRGLRNARFFTSSADLLASSS
jgi:hypothetical protein